MTISLPGIYLFQIWRPEHGSMQERKQRSISFVSTPFLPGMLKLKTLREIHNYGFA